MTTLSDFVQQPELQQQLLSESQIHGVITALACAPHPIDPQEWFSLLWGGEEQSPFTSSEALEQFANLIVQLWNENRATLLQGQWQWPESCALDEEALINDETQAFAEGFLQGWQICQDDWYNLIGESEATNQMVGGCLLAFSLFCEPQAAINELVSQGIENVDEQFHELFQSTPELLNGLTYLGQQLVDAAQDSDQ
ncbi:hypothetical protein VST7929_00860 [Vibrio stylophorae]|uniref:YecA family protein n=1 Tax=Vibrio stylophorae TaxID=659351 RepID=A0ABN8DW69_9VIBR|nr:UPF0149 family protein [Vibrio stylophorae]CAH0533009.1 hypothetical protein VST7929_00860 [Vibrio stylophorae]